MVNFTFVHYYIPTTTDASSAPTLAALRIHIKLTPKVLISQKRTTTVNIKGWAINKDKVFAKT